MTEWFISQQNGNDLNTGSGSYLNAWKTFSPCNAAVSSNIIQSGDIVYVGPGIYTSGESPYSSIGNHLWARQDQALYGTPTAFIYFLADPTCTYLIVDTPGEVQVDFTVVDDAWVIIEGFDFFGYCYQGVDYFGSISVQCSNILNYNCIAYIDKCKIAERSWISNSNVKFTNCLMNYAEVLHEVILDNNNNSFSQTVDLEIISCTLQMPFATGVQGMVFVTATDTINVYSINNIYINFGSKCGGTYIYNLIDSAFLIACEYNHYEYYDGLFAFGVRNLEEWKDVTGLDMSGSAEGWSYLKGFYQNASGYKLYNLSSCIGTGAPTGSFGGLVPYYDIEYNLRSGSATCKGCYEYQDMASLHTKTYYVRTFGNDLNDGLSSGSAFKTLKKATDTAQPYDIIYIGSGTYNEGFYMSASGSYTTWIGDKRGIYTGDSPGDIITQFFLNMTNRSPYYLIQPKHHVKVSNIYFYYFYGITELIHASIVSYQSHGVEFRQCRATHGFYCAESWGCRFINNAAWASSFLGSINYSRCAMNGGGGCSNIYFHNTFIHSYGRAMTDGVCFNGSRYDIVVNNIIKCLVENSGSFTGVDPVISIPAGSADECVFDGNFYQYGEVGQVFAWEGLNSWDTLIQWQSGSSQDLDSLEGDPLFESDGFHIQILSPCVDTALRNWTDWDDAEFVVGVYIDYDLQGRPMGRGPDIGCDEVYRPYPDVFEVLEKGPRLIRVTPYREPQLKWPCTHYLPNRGQFNLTSCPRCLGKGFYYDIQFDAGGLVPQVWDETKLGQELEKITITEFNPFHPEYGAKLKTRVGQVSVDELKPIIKADILSAVYNLIKYQKREANKGVGDGYFSSRELIDSVIKVEIGVPSPTELNFAVYILTVEGKELEITGKVLV